MIELLPALLGALAIGLSLGLLGSGGSILTVPVLVYLLGQDEKTAIAGSLFIVGSIALAESPDSWAPTSWGAYSEAGRRWRRSPTARAWRWRVTSWPR